MSPTTSPARTPPPGVVRYNEFFGRIEEDFRYPSIEIGSVWQRLVTDNLEEDELEQFHGFRPGGLHPIQLQDELHDGRYRVIHKLGHGGYATVWLCRDQHADPPAYVAVKILQASETEKGSGELRLAESLARDGAEIENLSLPLHHFISQSFNGKHLCLVYPVFGPAAKEALRAFQGNLSELQEVLRQLVATLAELHDRGICHGDLRPSNVLLGLRSLDGLDEEQVLSRLGKPDAREVFFLTDSYSTPEFPPCAPRHLVYPPNAQDYVSDILPRAQVIDFDQSFHASQQPPPTTFGIPLSYAAPEIIFDKAGSMAMDLWSLACTLFEIRTNRRLIIVCQDSNGDFEKSDYLVTIAEALGTPPEAWAKYFAPGDEKECGGFSIQEQLARLHSDFRGWSCSGSNEGCAHPRYQLVLEAEAVSLADLLKKLMRFDPGERISAQEALEHPWFHTDWREVGVAGAA